MRRCSSIGRKRNRDKHCKIVRRGKHVYVINKVNKRYKVKQG